jgi:hypothetical protein
MEFLADTTKSSAGYDVFVDYSPADLEMVQELARDFESRGHRTFVDKQQLNVGRDWQLSIDEALAYSSILLVCFGQPTDNERRAHIIATARRLQTVKIILVLLPGSDENAISSFDFSIQQAIDLHNWNDMAARERLSKLVEDASRPASRPFATVATVERDPYPGMRPFREDDASYFFGREDDLNSLEQALTDNDIVVVTGAAQIGKTSLVQAGLLPRLRQFDRDHALYFANIQCLDLATEQIQPRKGRSVKPELLLIDSIDTFEHEGSEAARNARLLWLQDVVDSASAGCKLVLVGRDAFGIESDFDLLGLTQRPRARSLVLKSLSREALGRAIEEPARRAAHLLEPGLVERLIESAGPAYNAIAQIQQVLFTIWSERKRGWLTNISLDSAGHLGGIVTLQHRRFLEQLTPYERTAASVLFGRLITLSASYAIVPVPQPWRIVSTIPALECVDAIALRDRLVRNGVIDLFRTTEVLELEKDLWETTIKLTRPDLSPYLELGGAQPDFRFLLWRDPNNANAERWKRDADAVLRGSALTEANQWLATHENQLTALERSFIMDSTRVYELEIRREHERQVTEQANREGRERERREAAEALAAVQTERLKVEQATIRRLIKGRIALLLLLAISVLLAGLAFVRSQQAQEAGILAKQEALRANAEAQRANAEAQRARAEKQSTEILLNNTSQARDALQAALAIANDARVAAESALEAPTQEARQLASEQLITLGNKIDAAQTSVSKLEDGCPVGQRFYIHIASDNDRAPAKALIRVLEAEGFIVPGIELVDTAPRQSAVRYFQAAEAPVAKKVAILLREQGIPGIVPTFISGYENSTNIRPCHYEIWFAMDAFARANKQ